MNLRRPIFLLSLLCTASSPMAVEAGPEILLVEDFEGGQQNRLGGFHEKYQAGASVAQIDRDSHIFRGQSGNSLSIASDRQSDGFCGVWLQFFDFRAPLRQYFDARPYGYLSFWVKGRSGGERFTVKLADRKWIEKEDSLAVGEILKFLPKGVTQQWQEVLIPLASLKSLDLQQLGGLSIDFSTAGRHAICIDDISFKASKSVATPHVEIANTSDIAEDSPKAMWLWESQYVLHDASRREKLFSLCRAEGIEQLWMQLDYRINEVERTVVKMAKAKSSSSVASNDVECEIADQVAWHAFLSEAHHLRIQVHALDGRPEFALKTKHSTPLAVVDSVIQFNRESTPEERFDGIHFDNEPYLLPCWEDTSRRTQILREFLELNAECQRRVRTQSEMTYGIDIPFWWHEIDKASGKPLAMVTFAGKKKSASHHCIDMLDQVGIMNYRDAAEGADGMIAHGSDLITYAQRSGGAKIYMGVETFMSPPADVWFVVGVPRKRFEAAIRAPDCELANVSRIENLRVHRIDDGQNIHVGLELPSEPTSDDLQRIQSQLTQISKRFGATSAGVPRTQLNGIRSQAETFVRINPEWNGFRKRDISMDDGGDIAGFIATNSMLSKLTFADNSMEDLHIQMKATERYFGQSKQFGGMAIHSYESLQKLGQQKRIALQK